MKITNKWPKAENENRMIDLLLVITGYHKKQFFYRVKVIRENLSSLLWEVLQFKNLVSLTDRESCK